MSFEVKWSEDHVLSIKMSDALSIDEMRQMVQEIEIALSDAQPPVFSIWDLSELHSHPTKVKEIWDIALPVIKHKTLSHVIFIGMKNPILRFTSTVISNMGRLSFHMEDDWDGVKRAIEKLKSTYSLV